MSIDMQKLAADLVGANRVVPVRADDLAQISLDAERYRWLRNKSPGQFEHPIVVAQARANDHMKYVGPLVYSDLDAAIDAAMDAERLSAGFGAALELTRKAIK